MDLILFKFEGNIYRFETLASKNFTASTRAISKEQALNNLKSQAKSKLGYVNSAKVNLEGTLSIIYKEDKEIYKVDKQNKFYLIESNFDESNFIILNDNKVKYNGQIVSLEQAKYLSTLDDEDTRYVITYENGNKEDITGKVKVVGSCILYKDEDYLYDSEENVYWKFGIPFSSRIEIV